MNPCWLISFRWVETTNQLKHVFCECFCLGVLPDTSTTTNPGRLNSSRTTSFGQDPWPVLRGFHHDLLGESILVTLKLDKMVSNLGGGNSNDLLEFSPRVTWGNDMIQFDWRIFFFRWVGVETTNSRNKIGAHIPGTMGPFWPKFHEAHEKTCWKFQLWWLEGSHRMHYSIYPVPSILSMEGIPNNHLGYMDISKNRGTPKWMVYNGKPY